MSDWFKRHHAVRLTPAIRGKVKAAYKAGMKVKDMSIKFQLSIHKIYECLGKDNRKRKRMVFNSPETIDRMFKMKTKLKMSNNAIAKEIGCSSATVSTILKLRGIDGRIR
jgi:DNA invertase Pin-like site-specific DNA recombinase